MTIFIEIEEVLFNLDHVTMVSLSDSTRSTETIVDLVDGQHLRFDGDLREKFKLCTPFIKFSQIGKEQTDA